MVDKTTPEQLREIRKARVKRRRKKVIHKHWINKAMTNHIHFY